MTARGFGRTAALSLLTTGAGVAVWSTMIERHLYTLRHEELPTLPRGSRPLRVLHLSDLHLAPWQHGRMSWVRSLGVLEPDLVVLTGDLMGHKDSIDALRFTLEPLGKYPGVFVHGSNDYYAPMLKNPLKYLKEPSRLSTRVMDLDNIALTRMLTDDLGFADLNNAAADVTVQGVKLRVFGLGDPHICLNDIDAMRERLAPLDAGGHAEARVGVVHAPYIEALNGLLADQADLLIAGHTHGGQVRLPGIGALTSNSDLPAKQARGLSVWFDDERAAFLHVSAGLGHSIYAPVRFACRPEATMITMTGR